MTTHEPRVTPRELLVHSLILLALVAAVFPGVFLRGEMTVAGDLLYERLPWKHYTPDGLEMPKNWVAQETLVFFIKCYALVEAALRNGEWPLWNHQELLGMPLLANYQSTVFYPLRLFHAFFDLFLATTLYTLLKLWLCGFTAYLCGRAMNLGVTASRFLSCAWMLGNYNLIWLYWSPPDTNIWAPVVFMGAEMILRGAHRRGFHVLALGATIILLAGHPESAFTFGLGAGAYFVLRLLFEMRRGRSLWEPVAWAGAAWALALLVSAAQLLPFFEYLPYSDNVASRPEGHGVKQFVPPGGVVAFWVPRFYGHAVDGNYWGDRSVNTNIVSLIYPGIAVWVGVVLLAARREYTRLERHRILAVLLPTVLLAMMAFPLPTLRPIQELPLLSTLLRCYYVTFPMFALPMLAAFGFRRWFARKRRVVELVGVTAAALCIGAALAAWAGMNRQVLVAQGEWAYLRHQLLVAGGLTLAATLVLGLSCRLRRPAALLTALIALLAADLVYAARDYHPTAPRERLYPETPLIEAMRDLGPHIRFSAWTARIEAGLLQPYGFEQLQGYDGITPRRIVSFFWNYTHLSSWDRQEPLCSVEYYLFPENAFDPAEHTEEYDFVATIDGVHIMRNTRAYPRAFLVGEVETVPTIERLFERMGDPAFDTRHTALTEAPPRAPLPKASTRDPGAARLIERSSTRVVVEVEAREECVLVLTDGYFPGWSARVDGQAAEIFPVYYVLRGVIVPAGAHTVEYTYFPWSFRLGLALSTVTLIAAAAIALRRLRRLGARPS